MSKEKDLLTKCFDLLGKVQEEGVLIHQAQILRDDIFDHLQKKYYRQIEKQNPDTNTGVSI